jgi:hypothetical protein
MIMLSSFNQRMDKKRMPIFFRGAGLGTYWHPSNNNARLLGFTPHFPGMARSHNRLMHHIAVATTSSPYISLTRSWGVALSYALNGRAQATQTDPAYIYEIELDDPLPIGLILLDPVREVVNSVPSPTGMPYQHDGSPDFLLGVVDPIGQQKFLSQVRPHPIGAVSRPANLSLELTTIVRALRDAEIIAVGTIPAQCVTNYEAIF